MAKKLKLLCVLAHPDDETFDFGSVLAKYAAEGVEIHLLTATRGEKGWNGPEEEDPGLEALGRIREAELCESARVLGIHEVNLLDYIDGELDQADVWEAIDKIAGHIRRVRPQVVVTFGPEGIYGHPDHIAISQFTTAAIVAAAEAGFSGEEQPAPFSVDKLYYLALSQDLYRLFLELFGDIKMTIDGVERFAVAYPDWAVTTRIDASGYWKKAWEALQCHQSQLASLGETSHVTEVQHQQLWGSSVFYRAFSRVNGGREVETDLFAGVRLT